MCPVERDCGGRMPLAYTSFVEGERVMPSRGERAKKLGLEVRTEADLVAPEDPRKAGTTVYHVTAGEDPKQYEVGNLEETLEGLRVLNGMDETDMQKNGPFGADLLLYSALAAEEPDEELRDKLREGEKWPLPKKSEVMATMDLAASLVTGKGTIVVIAPLGMPVFWLTQPISDSVMERTGAPKGSRLNVVGQRAIFVESFRAVSISKYRPKYLVVIWALNILQIS